MRLAQKLHAGLHRQDFQRKSLIAHGSMNPLAGQVVDFRLEGFAALRPDQFLSPLGPCFNAFVFLVQARYPPLQTVTLPQVGRGVNKFRTAIGNIRNRWPETFIEKFPDSPQQIRVEKPFSRGSFSTACE